MIHEFAFEPAALSRLNTVWQAMEQFGVQHGRVISEVPKSWLRDVYEATNACPPVERKSLEERPAHLRRKVIRFRRNRPWDSTVSWRENAHREDTAEPFRALIQSDDTEQHARVLTPFDLHDANPLWRVDREIKIARSPEALAAVLGPLGRISRELLFIDPHFSTEARWFRVLLASLTACGTEAGRHRRIEVHTGPNPPRSHFENSVQQWIAPQLPKNIRIKFVLWQSRDLGEKLHARYFLTDRGGIRFDVGLDAGEPGETTDVGLLSDDLYRSRWTDFQEETAAYSKVDQFEIIGTQ